MVDGLGRLKGKQYEASVLLDRLASGALRPEVCAYVFATDLAMTPADGFALASWSDGYGDVRLQPAADARLLPWLPRNAVVFADPVAADGRVLPVAPAAVLQQQINALGVHDLEARVGLETEFVLYRGTLDEVAADGFRDLVPVTFDNRDYSLDQPQKVRAFAQRLQSMLALAEMPVEAVKLEGAPGQIEVTFPYGYSEAACEQHVLFKHAVRVIAEDAGLAATFMAAPSDDVGSGLHLHVSLWRGNEPLLGHPEDTDQLSKPGRHAVAGLLEVLPDLAPLYAPYVNSYKRYREHSFAPTRFSWGWDNRSCAVRVVGHGPGLHLEVRLPGADANPYLALAATLAAARYGIENALELPPPCSGNAYQDDSTRAVPATLEEAVRAFEASAVAAALFGPDVVAHYSAAARAELRAHHRRVTDVEIARGFAQA
ncbi:glutamine synthetase family protein [Kitasatospora sp. HPMI-4]|uniref:glutamine synthetase family protein n=1 Tax=Kitasatospora sp. HPMI-4 TaxID=3448443 RepID=UPI003F1C14B1